MGRPSDRIIPARAGFTFGWSVGWERRSDHPRSRGVYVSTVLGPEERRGSSPLARGLQRPILPNRNDGGIIPARAGFTLPITLIADWFRDHPRSRGVYKPPLPQNELLPGSSPLARGLLRESIRFRLRRRIIPARAGFTRHTAGSTEALADHPRSRGVYLVFIGVPFGWCGSSPLARGLPCSCRARAVSEGIIPARAGFTSTMSPPMRASRDHPRSRGVYETMGFSH